jgi:dihydroorotase
MKVLIKQVTILDSNSEFHLQKKDILLENGIFTKIENNIEEVADKIIEEKDSYISGGFVDIFCHLNDPGFEQKETLLTGALAAQKGGYTTVFCLPNTNPCIDNKTNVEYILQQSKTLPIHILPIGSVTKNIEGKELAEMIEMQNAGTIACSDGLKSVQQSSILLKTLQYVKTFDGIIMQLPIDETLSANGYVNEGVMATRLGLPSIPAIAEELIVARDIELCAYTNSKLHITGISTAKSLVLIKDAKEKNISITCSVTPYHLLLDESEIDSYNTNAKVNPPLRTKEDVIALQKGVLDGTIDCIASHHQPHEMDAKQCEFAYAQYGMSTIEHTFNALVTIPTISPEKINTHLHKNATNIFGLPKNSIQCNELADATLFTLHGETRITEKEMLSKGKNSAFINKNLKGKIIATICKSNIHIA